MPTQEEALKALADLETWTATNMPVLKAALLEMAQPAPEVPEPPVEPEKPEPPVEPEEPEEPDYTPVTADFSFDLGDGYVPCPVKFTSKATGDVKSIVYDCGNGNLVPGPDGGFTYINPGKKPVTMRVIGMDGSMAEARAEFSLKTRPTPKPTVFGLPRLCRSAFEDLDGLTWRKNAEQICKDGFRFDGVDGVVWGGSEGWATRNAANVSVTKPNKDAKPALRVLYPERTEAYRLGGGANIMVLVGSKTTPTEMTGFRKFAVSFKIYPDQSFSNAQPKKDATDPDGLKGVPGKMAGIGGGLINGVVGNGNCWNDGQGPAEERGQWREDGTKGARRGFSYRFQFTGRWDRNIGCLKPIWGCGDRRTDRNDLVEGGSVKKSDVEWGKNHYGLRQPAFTRVDIKRGEYNEVQIYFEANTPGRNDGVIIYQINGVVIHEEHDVMHRSLYQALGHSWWLNTFFGGNAQNDPLAGSPRLNSMWFDDVQIAGAN